MACNVSSRLDWSGLIESSVLRWQMLIEGAALAGATLARMSDTVPVVIADLIARVIAADPEQTISC